MPSTAGRCRGGSTRVVHLRRTTAKILGALFLLAGLAGWPAHAEEPTAARALYNTFSDEEEMTMGRQAAEETEKHLTMLDATLLSTYLDGLGQKVARTSRRPGLHYSSGR